MKNVQLGVLPSDITWSIVLSLPLPVRQAKRKNKANSSKHCILKETFTTGANPQKGNVLVQKSKKKFED